MLTVNVFHPGAGNPAKEMFSLVHSDLLGEPGMLSVLTERSGILFLFRSHKGTKPVRSKTGMVKTMYRKLDGRDYNELLQTHIVRNLHFDRGPQDLRRFAFACATRLPEQCQLVAISIVREWLL